MTQEVPKCDRCGTAFVLCGHEQKIAARAKIAEAAALGYDILSLPRRPSKRFTSYVRDRDGIIYEVRIEQVEDTQ